MGLRGVLAEGGGFPFAARVFEKGHETGALVLAEAGQSVVLLEKGRIAGRTGFEAMANGVLAGSAGMIRWERDSVGNELLSKWHVQEAVQLGADVTLTLDAEIQSFCMEALEKSTNNYLKAAEAIADDMVPVT